MKIVAENLNEAIKHLKPKTGEEIEKSIPNFSADELIVYGLEHDLPKYVLQALKTGETNYDKYTEVYRKIIPLFLKYDFEEGINFLCKENPTNIEEILENAAMNNINTDKWAKKLIPLLNNPNTDRWYTLRANTNLWRTLMYAAFYNHPATIKLLLKYKIATTEELAEIIIDGYLDKWGPVYKNPEQITEIIKLAFSNYNINKLPTSSHKNPTYKQNPNIKNHKLPDSEKEYLHVSHKRRVKAIIKLMKIAKMDQKLIQPFIEKVYSDTITVSKLITMLQKYDPDDHIVINYDIEESSLQSGNDYQHITHIEPIKDDSGDMLNIKTTKFRY